MTNQILLRVNEIFTSIQGEGIHAGRPMHFVRVSGCNLKCVYCDTPDHESGTDLSIDRIIERICNQDILPVYITGGEPLLASGTLHLIIRLLSEEREVHLDTNGSLDLSPVAPHAHKIVDMKTPGSGSADSFLVSNLNHISKTDEIKFIVTSKEDYDWSIKRIKDLNLINITDNLIFQPAWGMLDPEDLVNWIKMTNLPVRMSLQLHKLIWGPGVKSV